MSLRRLSSSTKHYYCSVICFDAKFQARLAVNLYDTELFTLARVRLSIETAVFMSI